MNALLPAVLFSAPLLFAPMAFADTLSQPKGDVILTVSGSLGQTNTNDTATFDLAMLRDLPSESFTTSTIWTEGESEFTGIALSQLVAILGADGSELKATALNDYAVTVPMTDAIDGGPIVAYLVDGEPMPLRDKGPLWIVYPYDSSKDYQTEVIYSRSIWQLDRIEILP